MNYEKLRIVAKKNGISEIVNVEKIEIGFNNLVYSINDKYILKVCNKFERETFFKNEIDFYNSTNYSFVPKLYSYDLTKEDIPFYYMIQEKIHGDNLFKIWSNLSKNEKDSILNQILEIMKVIHFNTIENFDSSKIMNDTCSEYIKDIIESESLTIDKINYLYSLKNNLLDFHTTSKITIIHGDIQFNNIIYTRDNNIKLIDFENVQIAPIEKEFDPIYRMANNPASFLQKDNECKIDLDSFQYIKEFFEKNYKGVCDSKKFENNIEIYEIINAMRWISKYPENEIYNEILFEKSKKYLKR